MLLSTMFITLLAVVPILATSGAESTPQALEKRVKLDKIVAKAAKVVPVVPSAKGAVTSTVSKVAGSVSKVTSKLVDGTLPKAAGKPKTTTDRKRPISTRERSTKSSKASSSLKNGDRRSRRAQSSHRHRSSRSRSRDRKESRRHRDGHRTGRKHTKGSHSRKSDRQGLKWTKGGFAELIAKARQRQLLYRARGPVQNLANGKTKSTFAQFAQFADEGRRRQRHVYKPSVPGAALNNILGAVL